MTNHELLTGVVLADHEMRELKTVIQAHSTNKRFDRGRIRFTIITEHFINLAIQRHFDRMDMDFGIYVMIILLVYRSMSLSIYGKEKVIRRKRPWTLQIQ